MAKLIDDLGIDDGSLRGLPQERVFVLGVEVGMVRTEMNYIGLVGILETTVHRANVERLRKMAEKRGHQVSVVEINKLWAEMKIRPSAAPRLEPGE